MMFVDQAVATKVGIDWVETVVTCCRLKETRRWNAWNALVFEDLPLWYRCEGCEGCEGCLGCLGWLGRQRRGRCRRC